MSGDSEDGSEAGGSAGEAEGEGPSGADGPPTIRELDDRTVRQIAAGEVVERPASVVKELVENSLDADADRISVAVEAGGTEGIRVRDDGLGMDREAVERAVEEHTTSKIDDIDDLEAGVGTLGFRGEALHTIGAVSRLTIRTKPRGGGVGTELRVAGGDVAEVGPAGCPEGTVVEVADLFYNTPARRKFLKTTATEFDHVNTVVTHYALANPGVAISLEHDDREVFATEGRGSLQSAVLSVYGREVAESMIRVGGESGTADGDGPIEAVTGLVSHPETTRSTREYLSTFVNGRYVTSSVLREAVLGAYGGQLASDRYPFAVLFVDVPPESVDVNVHPRKMELRFDDESGVREAVTEAVRSALLDEGLIRSAAPRGRSAPAETEIAPESPDREVRGGAGHGPERGAERESDRGSKSDETGGSGRADVGGAPGDERDADSAGDDHRTDDEGTRTVDPEDDTAWTVRRSDVDSIGSSADAVGSDTGAVGSDDDSDTGSDVPPGLDGERDADERTRTDSAAGSDTGGTRPREGDIEPETDSTDSRDRDRRDATASGGAPEEAASFGGDGIPGGVVGPTVQRDLQGEAATLEPEFDSLPSMRVLGQLHDTYVVAEAESGLVLIDQHAADERVNYERLRAELDGDVATQALAEPVEIELTAREAALFSEYRQALATLGFRAERVDERTVAVESVPAVFAEALDPELLRDVLTAFVGEEGDGAGTVEAVADDLLADLACYPSVTGNTSLTEGSVVELLEALDGCENPYACPHGRPVVVSIDGEEIGSRFERDYPGHGGRRDE